LEVAGLTGEGEALAEDRAHPVMDDELGPKQLQGALGERALVEADPQGDLPAQIEGGPRRGLVVGDPVVRLQEQRARPQARGHARASVIRTVPRREMLVTKALYILVVLE